MALQDSGEFGLIGKIDSIFGAAAENGEIPMPEGSIGIGDDCALTTQRNGMQTLVSTDMLVEGTHFILADISAYDLGWKSAAVNFSDIAACGGRAVGSFLSLALPGSIDEIWMGGFIAGYKDMSRQAGAPLLGGDTTSSPEGLCINVTVMGEIRQGCAKLRSAAREGDLICVTGALGDSAAGLELILQRSNAPTPDGEIAEREAALIHRHYHPVPRLAEGVILAETPGVHAMMDISDGIASDLRHILKASAVGARVYESRLPLSDRMKDVCAGYGWDAVKLALEGGEDYELLFTMNPETKPGIPYYVIGEITDGDGIVWDKPDTDYCGFRHF